MTHHEIANLQRGLNSYTKRELLYFQPLRVDGQRGPATAKRVRQVKYYIGYTRPRIDAVVGHEFHWRLHHSHTLSHWSDRASLQRGHARRHLQHVKARRSHQVANWHPGVTTYNGVPCAIWLTNYETWAKRHGWQGRLNSGFRTKAYSQHLCYVICGRPTCPGRCAGIYTNHVGTVRPKGAVDNTDYTRYGAIIRYCPYSPRIFNALGAQDPVHFSATGR